MVYSTYFEHVNVVDGIMVIILLWTGIWGCARGMFESAIRLIGLVTVSLIALYMYPSWARKLYAILSFIPLAFWEAAVLGSMWIFLSVLWNLLCRLFSLYGKWDTRLWSRFPGLVIGLIHGACVGLMWCLIVVLVRNPECNAALIRSASVPLLFKTAERGLVELEKMPFIQKSHLSHTPLPELLQTPVLEVSIATIKKQYQEMRETIKKTGKEWDKQFK